MSANDGAMMQRMPKSSSAQGACSRVAILRLVEHEIGILAAVLVVAHLVEQRLAQSRTPDGLQELLGNDHVGVDVGDRQRRRDTGQSGELFHDFGVSSILCG